MRHQGKEDSRKREATREKRNSRAIHPGAVSQIGEAVARNRIEWDNGRTLNTHTRLGNTMTHMGAGPGGGCSVRRSGSQALHGINPGNPTPARDILSEYGPDYKGSR